jgi:Beta-ketoacyl synthase, N-terminal domain
MAATHDKFGRPIVVVTGMGVVTSLGAGKADNWKKLTAGESGIRTITRFPTDGLKTTMAGTVDFVPIEPFSSTDLSERLGELAAEEAVAQSGIGTKGDFPGPLFLAVAPVEVEWPQRQELGRAIGSATEIDYDAMLRVSGGGRYTDYHRRSRRPFGRGIRYQGLADLAVYGLCFGRNRDPARRRGDPAWRGQCDALCRHRWLGQSGGPGTLFPALGAVDPQRTAARRGPTIFEESRRLRDGGRRRRPGPGEP